MCKMFDSVTVPSTRRFSQRLIGKRVDYRMISGATPSPECGRSSGKQPLRTFTAERRPITRSMLCLRELPFDALVPTSTSRKRALNNQETTVVVSSAQQNRSVAVTDEAALPTEVQLCSREEVLESRNMAIEGKFFLSIHYAYEYLKGLPRPYTAEMFHSVLHDAFPCSTPRELKLGFKQLYHHVLCREGVLAFRENHGMQVYYQRLPVRQEDSHVDYGSSMRSSNVRS